MLPYVNTSRLTVTILVFRPDMFNAMGVGVVSPGAALGVEPGVTVNTQLPDGAIFPQRDGLIVVPLGSAGDTVYVTFAA